MTQLKMGRTQRVQIHNCNSTPVRYNVQ